MARGEIVITENYCKGCGYCEKFCPRGAIAMGNEPTSEGYTLPVLLHPEKCNACAICAWMCPGFAMEVYKILDKEQ